MQDVTKVVFDVKKVKIHPMNRFYQSSLHVIEMLVMALHHYFIDSDVQVTEFDVLTIANVLIIPRELTADEKAFLYESHHTVVIYESKSIIERRNVFGIKKPKGLKPVILKKEESNK